MHIVNRVGPRLSTRTLTACSSTPCMVSATACGGRRANSSLLTSFLGAEPTGESRSTAKTIKLSEQLQNSLEAMARHQTYSADVVDTLRSTAPAEPEPSFKKKKKKKKKQDAEDVQKADQVGLSNTTGHIYDSVSKLSGENWSQEPWSTNKVPPPLHRSNEDPKAAPASSKRPPIPFLRRIEGLLEPPPQENPLADLSQISEHNPIATLAHGLDRVLFNPGVHWVQDPRSGVYNFTPWLENIPKVNEFAFERQVGFVSSSNDQDLWELAKREGRPFAGSTSSLTKLLSHIYFLISGDKEVNTRSLSKSFQDEPKSFTAGQRMPASVVFNHKDGVYSIDSDKTHPGVDERNILTWMGTLLEKFLTTSPEEFQQCLRSSPPPPGAEKPKREAYRYAKSKSFVMRSQLDCVDSRLPGTGVFDIKTRAALPIRLDMFNHEENSGYLIRTLQGPVESFEKEYYDLIRSAFLKYSFQARIGNMDGVLVAYHNTARIFGFQYVPVEEMDDCLFGPTPGAGDRVFIRCLALLEAVADEVVRCFPGKSVRCTFETLEDSRVMKVWVQPVEEERDQDAATASADGTPATSPIYQLEVTAKNYLGPDWVRGSKAVPSSEDADWSVYWTISTLAADEATMHKSLDAARERQFRAWNIPAGMSRNDLEAFWDRLDFNAPLPAAGESDGPEARVVDAAMATLAAGGTPPPSTFDPRYFQTARGNVKLLRRIARSGRAHTQQIARERAGKPIVMWGVPEGELGVYPEVVEEEVLAEAELEEHAAEMEAAVDAEITANLVEELDEDLVESIAEDHEEVVESEAVENAESTAELVKELDEDVVESVAEPGERLVESVAEVDEGVVPQEVVATEVTEVQEDVQEEANAAKTVEVEGAVDMVEAEETELEIQEDEASNTTASPAGLDLTGSATAEVVSSPSPDAGEPTQELASTPSELEDDEPSTTPTESTQESASPLVELSYNEPSTAPAEAASSPMPEPEPSSEDVSSHSPAEVVSEPPSTPSPTPTDPTVDTQPEADSSSSNSKV
ncbi:hypothetical protein HGRIS_005692 [Hohenbuehelia grisea]|uniref:Pet127-domain-containing protein n=1 Tax=Hohenbuehelia grisea TaxID=104357 RepID=A0ABR3JZW7_9AGAR